MDQTISAIIGALIFTWFTAGLAESIGSFPFIFIVMAVIGCVGFCTWEVIKESQKPNGSGESSK